MLIYKTTVPTVYYHEEGYPEVGCYSEDINVVFNEDGTITFGKYRFMPEDFKQILDKQSQFLEAAKLMSKEVENDD